MIKMSNLENVKFSISPTSNLDTEAWLEPLTWTFEKGKTVCIHTQFFCFVFISIPLIRVILRVKWDVFLVGRFLGATATNDFVTSKRRPTFSRWVCSACNDRNFQKCNCFFCFQNSKYFFLFFQFFNFPFQRGFCLLPAAATAPWRHICKFANLQIGEFANW